MGGLGLAIRGRSESVWSEEECSDDECSDAEDSDALPP